MNNLSNHYRFIIVGGGSGGISAAARLKKKFGANSFSANSIALIEPSENHYYQPLWTLVGGGVVKKEITQKPMKCLIPNGVTWIKDSVIELIDLLVPREPVAPGTGVAGVYGRRDAGGLGCHNGGQKDAPGMSGRVKGINRIRPLRSSRGLADTKPGTIQGRTQGLVCQR